LFSLTSEAAVAVRAREELVDLSLSDVPHLGESHCNHLQCQPEDLPVKVSTGEDCPVGEDERVIRGGVDLDRHLLLEKGERLEGRAEDLRDAAQAIRVLYIVCSAVHECAPLEQRANRSCRLDLPGVRAALVEPFVEGRGERTQPLQGEGCRSKGVLQQVLPALIDEE
jgi:hypothetical protein